MERPKIGKKESVVKASKRFQKLYRQPVSQRISDFLKDEGKKERQHPRDQEKKIAQSASSEDLEF